MTAQSGAEAVVRQFARAWERCDVEGILALLAPDAVYQNVPLPAMIGHDAIRAFVAPNLQAADRMEWEFLHTVCDAAGKRVMTERVDSFIFSDGRVDVPVMGIFELEDGRIARWRDYADLGSFVRDMVAIGRAPGPGVSA